MRIKTLNILIQLLLSQVKLASVYLFLAALTCHDDKVPVPGFPGSRVLMTSVVACACPITAGSGVDSEKLGMKFTSKSQELPCWT